MKRNVEPMGLAHGRILSETEIQAIGGAGNHTGTLTGGGGGIPGPIVINPDYDYDYEW